MFGVGMLKFAELKVMVENQFYGFTIKIYISRLSKQAISSRHSTDPAKRGLSKTAQGFDLSDLPTFHASETTREIVKPAGTRSDTFLSLGDSVFVDNDISSAMGDEPFSGSNGVTTPVWRKEGLSFEDALVVDNTIAPPELGDHLSESQFGYNLYKMAKKYTTQ
ncbi:hypothetical protein CcCBS67573_g06030 [Chytriomyces confervae]|uniref:Uncharacterized protein n=1 Tax=Chytriomyces confervae TaxID=246404 RepID=A0A507F6Q1_9FUNG|nr:hypothetical protein CcCBS67573_g06030 [Chytriomyces confervae]